MRLVVVALIHWLDLAVSVVPTLATPHVIRPPPCSTTTSITPALLGWIQVVDILPSVLHTTTDCTHSYLFRYVFCRLTTSLRPLCNYTVNKDDYLSNQQWLRVK